MAVLLMRLYTAAGYWTLAKHQTTLAVTNPALNGIKCPSGVVASDVDVSSWIATAGFEFPTLKATLGINHVTINKSP